MLLSPLGFPARLAVDHRPETSHLPLAKRIYSAPYGRTINVIVDVRLVFVGGYEKGILALCPAHRRFIADAVGLLRRHLTVRARLPDLVAQRPVSGPAVGFALILIFDQHELGVCRGRIAEVGGNGPQLFRVQAIVKAVFQALQGRPLIGLLVGFEVGCGRRYPSYPYEKC